MIIRKKLHNPVGEQQFPLGDGKPHRCAGKAFGMGPDVDRFVFLPAVLIPQGSPFVCLLYTSCMNQLFQGFGIRGKPVHLPQEMIQSFIEIPVDFQIAVHIGLPQRQGSAGKKPVSYTHLDVYKRQIQEQNIITENVIIKKVSFVGIFGNIVLTAFKLFAGIFGKSGAMVSDAVHSLSDVFATLIAFIGVKISKQDADKQHPYGHERMECVASLILGLILLVTGLGIGKVGLSNIFSGNYENLAIPGTIALVAAVVSIVTKEGMYWYTRHYAKILNSPAFMADAWHHRSDAFSSIGSLIGIAGAMLGFPDLDSAASVVICIFILKVSYDILKGALANMLDTSCGDE